jgi:hypothetical protein
LTRSSYRFGRCKDSYLYRLRGDVLAKRDSNAAEAAYREALRVAREQDARTYGLQAAHALAKLYRSMNRATDAHAMLTPALEGFSPTSEFPEIEEAQKLLAALNSLPMRPNTTKLKLPPGLGIAISPPRRNSLGLWARHPTLSIGSEQRAQGSPRLAN